MSSTLTLLLPSAEGLGAWFSAKDWIVPQSSCDDLLGSLCPRLQLRPPITAMLIIP